MNAAFLLVTSTWLVGGQAAPPGAPPGAPPAQVAPAPTSSCGSCGSCGSTCGCNECDKPTLLERLKAKFKHDDCGCAPAPCTSCAPAPVYHHPATCGSCGSTCNECDKPTLLERLKAKFHREADCGCGAPACGTCSSCGAAPLPVKPAEQIKPPTEGPMKLPEGKPPEAKPGEISAPKNLELTPTGDSKIIESGTKNPF